MGRDLWTIFVFYTTFNAVLALANTALRASGYRTTNQQGHHTRTLETLEYTIGADPKLIRKLLAFSKKRNVAQLRLCRLHLSPGN